MARRRAFSIIYDPGALDHLEAIERKHHKLIRQIIEQQLTFEPDVPTRDRKPLTREVEFDADWELRFGPDNRFRVFHAVDSEVRDLQVLAIGVKRGNRLFIGGEESTYENRIRGRRESQVERVC